MASVTCSPAVLRSSLTRAISATAWDISSAEAASSVLPEATREAYWETSSTVFRMPPL